MHLDLSKNSIEDLPDKLCNITSLKWLSLQQNKLSSLPERIGNLFSLEYLDAYGRDENLISPVVIALEELQHGVVKLQCGYDLFIINPPDGFTYNGDIIKMDLSGLGDDQILNLGVISTLQELSVAFYDLDPKSYEIELPGNLMRMNISCNKYYNISQDFPKFVCQQTALQELNISNCNLVNVSEEIGLMVNLTHLDLSRNKIEDLPDELCNITSLRCLSLQDNKLSNLPVRISNLLSLEYLDVSFNRLDQYKANAIQSLPDDIGRMKELKYINLSSNSLNSLPQSIGYLQELEELILEHNQIEQLPDSIGTLKKLSKLRLSANCLKAVPKSLCNLLCLKEIYLSCNSLVSIPSSICRLKYLQTLDISENSLTELPEKIGDLLSLIVLNLRSNQLKELPSSFTRLVNLTSLNISSNYLKAIPEEMFEFGNLTEFNIAGNKIETLPNTICELQNLEYLSLEENNITALPTQFGKLHKLCQFGKEQIYGNPIEQPPIEVFEQGMEGIVAYFEELNLSKAIEVPRVKALLLGEVAAGKTSLCNAIRLGKSNLTDITDRTAGIEVHPTRLQDSIQVLMHDFGGHKIYHLTHQFFFSKAALYLIVVDLEAFISSSFDAAVKYWLNVIKTRLDSKPVLRIVATHIDRCEPEEIERKAELIMQKTKQIEIAEVESLKKYLSEIDDVLN
ncbi:leucine-rich repeat protein SHOC-2-like [Branchiostoma floridae]|uniref:Leucine-rich repeat protein SHOC-2-like n=1 Tax=Branchiostoma floridae TaxID=7739 RepID=A0A9J7LLQ3_BRAFL|nr:leucine-rich repeat protein SHOC-2-like [Branchiostoma floridae]